MMKYEVGDKVRVRTDLKLGEEYGASSYVEGMMQFSGKVVTIESYNETCSAEILYFLEEDKVYGWSEDMFEGLAEEGAANETTNNGNTIRPGYYQSSMGDVFDIAHAYKLDMPLGTAAKYILRAGKKNKAKEIEDLRKAIRCIEREIELLGGD